MVHADGVSNPGSPSLREDAHKRLKTHSIWKQVFESKMSSSAKDVSFMTALASGGTYPITRTRCEPPRLSLAIF